MPCPFPVPPPVPAPAVTVVTPEVTLEFVPAVPTALLPPAPPPPTVTEIVPPGVSPLNHLIAHAPEPPPSPCAPPPPPPPPTTRVTLTCVIPVGIVKVPLLLKIDCLRPGP